MFFFAVAFPCFMSVAGIPAFLEDRLMFIREYSNGSYSVLAYVIANSFIMIPFILLISFCFVIILYPSADLNNDPERGTLFGVLFFILLLVAEAMTLFVSSLIPVFVAALAIVSFLNGFFMVV